LLDAINRPLSLYKRAIEIGLTGFAITDHECLSAHVQILQWRDKLRKNSALPDNDENKDHSLPEWPEDFTVSLGNEAYLVDEIDMGIKYFHWLLIAKDEKGHRLLRRMSSQAWDNSYFDRGMERVPITKAQVEEIMNQEEGKGHLIVTSACIGGELGANALAIKAIEEGRIQDSFLFGKVQGLPEDLINQHKQNMVDYVLWNQRVFGEGNFFIELAPNDKEDQRYCNRMLSRLAKAMEVPLVFSTDAHYLSKEDQDIHRAFLNSKDGEREVDDFYSTAYVMDTQEVWEFMSLDFSEEEFEEMLDNLERMRGMVTEYSLERQQEIPQVDVEVPEPMFPHVPEEYNWIHQLLASDKEQDLFWIRQCLNELYKRGKWDDPRYLESMNNESEVIVKVSERMGQPMSAYYNTARRLIEIMWSKADSLVGASRGSALAFVSNWLLDITQIDPIPYEIPYWRHLSAARPELPDIDIDAEGFKREAIMDAMRDYFGADKVLNIITYGTEGTKSAIATACRGLGIDNDISAYLSSMVPNERGFDWSLKDMVEGNPKKGRYPIKTFIDTIGEYEGLLQTAMAIEGMVTKRGSHAAGVYIFNHHYVDINASMKAPNGARITQWDMKESDTLGGLKFDFLSIEALDKIRATMNLLLDAGEIERKPTLKETYQAILDPETTLDYDPELWKPAWKGKVLDLFQFQTPVGGDAIRKGKPSTVMEGAALNSLMRLMPMDDGVVPTDKFVMFKENIDLWYAEMKKAGVPEHEIPVLERHYLKSYGVPNTQEELMLLLMDEEVCRFTETEANKARKIIGKKLMNEIPNLRKKIFDQAVCSKETIQYIWNTAVSVQLGYSFSIPHTVAYTVIAVQELNLFNKYPSIYWNTACLIVNSGEEGDSSDYAKIAVAIGNIKKGGVTVLPIDINTSGTNFTPSVEKNAIYFGFRALSGVGDSLTAEILAKRPFTSLLDFQERVENFDTTGMVSLIKSGAFDNLAVRPTRRLTMLDYIGSKVDKKGKINLTNFTTLNRYGLIPGGLYPWTSLFEFNRYLTHLNPGRTNKKELVLDERAQTFYLDRDFDPDLLELKGGKTVIRKGAWEKIYDKAIQPLRDWLSDNSKELIYQLYMCETMELFEKYGSGTLSKWEMDSMSYYYHEHELAHVDRDKYGISNFTELEEGGDVSHFINIGGREIPIFHTTSIVGTILGKNRTKGSIDVLTPDGEVVLVKLGKEKFSHYDKQISEQLPGESKKTVVEKSWFQRGNKVLIHGVRRGQQFVPKTYKHTPYKSLYLIDSINQDGELQLRSQRA